MLVTKQANETVLQKHFLVYMASYELRDKINLENYRQNYMNKFDALLKSLGLTITENRQNSSNNNDDWKAKALERQRKRKEEKS